MATHKSAIKRTKQDNARNLRNKSNRTRVKQVIKGVSAAINEKSAENAQAALTAAVPVIQRASKKGAIHRRTASRKISRLTRQVNAITS
ncbi:MAG: 30S ribosomal protein S20 [Desulfobacterales bacterium]|nr:30S ribosomal protein S20 [Desulfobacterales bacterium]